MHIHFATAGKVPAPIMKGFKLIPGIEKVYLFYSGQYLESAEEIAEYLLWNLSRFRNMISRTLWIRSLRQ